MGYSDDFNAKYKAQLRNSIYTIIQTLNGVRETFGDNLDLSFHAVDVCQKLMPDIKRALIFLRNTRGSDAPPAA